MDCLFPIRQDILRRKTKLGSYNAQFFQDDNRAHASRQQLGAVAAVVETKRIIERELSRLRSDSVATESKLNLAHDANGRIHAQINGLREDRLTFRRLYGGLSAELLSEQAKVEGLRRKRDDAYALRDHAQAEMRELAKAFELDKLERVREWHVLTQASCLG